MITFRRLFYLLLILLLSTLWPICCFANEDTQLEQYYSAKLSGPDYFTVKAKVLEIPYDDTAENRPDVPRGSDFRYQHLKLKITSGKHNGELFTVKNTIEMINPYKLIIENGETIIMRLYENESGQVENLVVYERSKEKYLYAFIALFMLLLVLIGGLKGLKSIITLTLTALLVVFVMLPLILKDFDPSLTSIMICIIITIVTLVIISGPNKKTLNALLGTTAGVLIAGLLSLIVGNLCKLTGLGDENAQLLAYVPQYMNLDYKGLLFSGIIIGSLGAVMDVTMSVASAMSEITQLQPSITSKALINSGMNIGKDVMGSMSNTLILAYAGGSLHIMILLMAFHVSPLEIINMDLITSEIIRSIAGSIGLICAIPITAMVGGLLHGKTLKSKALSTKK